MIYELNPGDIYFIDEPYYNNLNRYLIAISVTSYLRVHYNTYHTNMILRKPSVSNQTGLATPIDYYINYFIKLL